MMYVCPTCKGKLLCGVRRGQKSGFDALSISVEIRAMFLSSFMAALTFMSNMVSLKVVFRFKH